MLNTNVIEPRVSAPNTGWPRCRCCWPSCSGPGCGGIGLVLATPLTVCRAVPGKHVPALRFFAVVLGCRPVLWRAARSYQRLPARDRHEAAEVVKDYLAAQPAEHLCTGAVAFVASTE